MDSIKPTYAPAKGTYRASPRRTLAPGEVDTQSDDKPSNARPWNRIERRSGMDRRKQQKRNDPKFDLRSSAGRRRTDRGTPFIETKA